MFWRKVSLLKPHASGGLRAKKYCARGARASGPPAQQFENQFESPNCLLSNPLVGLD